MRYTLRSPRHDRTAADGPGPIGNGGLHESMNSKTCTVGTAPSGIARSAVVST